MDDLVTTTEIPLTTTPASAVHTLVKLCVLWSVHHKTHPPKDCDPVLKKKYDNDHIDNLIQHHHGRLHNHSMPEEPEYTDEYSFVYSLTVIGVLGGIVLLFIVFVAGICIKYKGNLQLTFHYPKPKRVRPVNEIWQGSSLSNPQVPQVQAVDSPPHYDKASKKKQEDEPPSYLEATTHIINNRFFELTTTTTATAGQAAANHDQTIEMTNFE